MVEEKLTLLKQMLFQFQISTFQYLFNLQILEIIRVILKLYDQWKNFDDRKEIAAMLNKMPKPKPPPNRYILGAPFRLRFPWCAQLSVSLGDLQK